MKLRLSTYHAADLLHADGNANWSYNGALALVEYLEEYEEESGAEIELDVVAIRCDFAEYESLQDWAHSYWGGNHWRRNLGIDPDDDTEDEEYTIRNYIQDNGQLIEFEGGVIVSAF
jgi:hypothetical protein